MKYYTLIAVLFFFLSSCKQNNPEINENQIIKTAKEIHKRVITIDTHNDIDVKNFTDSINYTQKLNNQVNLPKMKEGGLDVTWLIVYTGQDTLTDQGFQKAYNKAISKFDAIHKLVNEIAPNEIELATNAADVERIHSSGKKVAMIGIENGYPIGMDINNVKKFYDLGGRYMSLAHNGHSQLCDSNTGEADDIWLHNGLSPLGKEVIVEMNKWGMMIDVSHPSKESMRQMIELSKAPIIASHSSSRTLCDHSRNLDDEQLEWMKQNGGLVQTVAFSSYLNTEKYEARNEKMKDIKDQIIDSLDVTWYEWKDFNGLDDEEQMNFIATWKKVSKIAEEKAITINGFPPAVNVSDFVDHIDYLVEKMGIEHVGISSDFDGGGGIEGWSDASETLNVTIELVRRGYSEKEIEMIWGGNLMRVLTDVERIAKEIQSGSD